MFVALAKTVLLTAQLIGLLTIHLNDV